MSTSTSVRRRLTDLFRLAGAAAPGRVDAPTRVEALEPRVLLSSAVELPAGVEMRPWGDGEVAAIEDSWIATFDRSVNKETKMKHQQINNEKDKEKQERESGNHRKKYR
eukprot:TRINITY_DN17053_c0_g1_i5.p4 TRINITY_DN17053_c0_g1~~TRINITY_DN17053_c0_g1_i5.p4  ORF type:complete len:109 (-),score=18.07 TRINITY_DN17053_c0_g1_i5:23-349(-)